MSQFAAQPAPAVMADELLYAVDGAIATITLNAPQRMNTISGPMLRQLTDALVRANEDRAVRVIVLTGAGRAFCAGLNLAVIGILLVPFAIVAYVLAAAGMVTLGYLAMAQLTGQAFVGVGGDDEIDRRARALKSMMIGLTVLLAPWFVASALAWSSIGGVVMRMVAVAITWVAATAGLGAALMSRGGARPATRSDAGTTTSTGWATPTPVAGVAAARRPSSPTSTGTPR